MRKADFAAVEAIRKLAQEPGARGLQGPRGPECRWASTSPAPPAAGSSPGSARSTATRSPKAEDGAKRAMPFAASERHEVWSADVRHLDMVDEELVGSKAYAVTVMDNYTRAILASAVTRRQDLSAFLSVFYRAVETLRGARNARHRLGVYLPRQPGEGGLRQAGREQGGDREGPPVAELFGDDLRHPAAHGRLALRQGRELGGTRRSARPVRLGTTTPRSHFAHQRREDGRRSPGGGPLLGLGDALPPRGPRARLLLRAPHARSRRLGLRHPDALASLRRGGTRRRGSGSCGFLENTLTVEHAGEPLSAYEVAYDAR